MKKSVSFAIMVAFALVAAGCSPDVGSEGWCKQMKEKPKGEWTANEVTDFSKHCIFK